MQYVQYFPNQQPEFGLGGNFLEVLGKLNLLYRCQFAFLSKLISSQLKSYSSKKKILKTSINTVASCDDDVFLYSWLCRTIG